MEWGCKSPLSYMTDKVILNRDYSCAPQGHTIEHFKKGQEVSGIVAEYALQDGAAKSLTPPPPPKRPEARSPTGRPKRTPSPKQIKPASPKHEG